MSYICTSLDTQLAMYTMRECTLSHWHAYAQHHCAQHDRILAAMAMHMAAAPYHAVIAFYAKFLHASMACSRPGAAPAQHITDLHEANLNLNMQTFLLKQDITCMTMCHTSDPASFARRLLYVRHPIPTTVIHQKKHIS
jgi:hypothetical protein